MSSIADRGVPRIGTELEPKKKNHKKKNQIATSRKQASDPCFWSFYSDKQREAYNAVLESLNISELPEPPAGYQKLFIETFKRTHRLDSDGMYPLSDGYFFDASCA